MEQQATAPPQGQVEGAPVLSRLQRQTRPTPPHRSCHRPDVPEALTLPQARSIRMRRSLTALFSARPRARARDCHPDPQVQFMRHGAGGHLASRRGGRVILLALGECSWARTCSMPASSTSRLRELALCGWEGAAWWRGSVSPKVVPHPHSPVEGDVLVPSGNEEEAALLDRREAQLHHPAEAFRHRELVA